MSMKKVIGYCILAVGLILILLSYTSVQTSLGFVLPAALSANTFFYGGIIILIVGAFIAFTKSGKKMNEVPIYHGKEVVGYRRLHK